MDVRNHRQDMWSGLERELGHVVSGSRSCQSCMAFQEARMTMEFKVSLGSYYQVYVSSPGNEKDEGQKLSP